MKIEIERLAAFSIALLLFWGTASFAGDPKWINLSSKNGQLPAPGESTQQTDALVADLDKDGVSDFVISFRVVAPALVWYRRQGDAWSRSVIEKEFLTVEAGGAAHEIDGDGDLDIVFGNDSQGDKLWWWENPAPNFDPNVSWKRRLIKNGGAKQHHDQAFGDFKGTGRPQPAFWNQGAKTIFLADIPPIEKLKDPRNTEPWPMTAIFSGSAGEKGDQSGAYKYAEGATAADVDGDGKVDLLAGNYWFKHLGGDKFKPIKVGTIGGRIAAAKLKPGKFMQVVIAPGDGNGPVKWYECTGNPEKESDWTGHDLAGRDLIHGHTLDVGDINGDGHQDIFAAEMAKWTRNAEPDNPQATAFIFYGDGKGNFRKTELAVGRGFHEGRVADLDGDGDLDILNKPYTWDAPRVDVWLNNGTAARESSPDAFARFNGKLGLQLYSLRFEFKKNGVAPTLDWAAKQGFRVLEGGDTYGLSREQFRAELDKRGMKMVGVFASFDTLRDKVDEAIAAAKAMGAEYVLCGWIPHQGAFSAEDVKKAAEVFNKAEEDLSLLREAELYVEMWGGHPGTASKRLTVNGRGAYAIPETGVARHHCTHQYPVIPLKVTDLVNGYNAVQFACEQGDSFWGHFIVDNAALRVALKPEHPDLQKAGLAGFSATVTAGANQNESIALALNVPESMKALISSVNYQGWHAGYDENGDGNVTDWHGFTKKREPVAFVAQAVTAPFAAAWNTSMLPDQREL